MAKTFKITLDDNCIDVIEETRGILNEGLLKSVETNAPLPWFADKMESTGGFLVYVILAYCQQRARTTIEQTKTIEARASIAASEAHIATAEASAEEIL